MNRLTPRQIEQIVNSTISVLTTGRIGLDVPPDFVLLDSTKTGQIGAAYYRHYGEYGHDEVVCALEFHDGSWSTLGIGRESAKDHSYPDDSDRISHLGSGGFALKRNPTGTMFYQKFQVPGSTNRVVIDGECRPSSESGLILVIWVEEGHRSTMPSHAPLITLE